MNWYFEITYKIAGQELKVLNSLVVGSVSLERAEASNSWTFPGSLHQ